MMIGKISQSGKLKCVFCQGKGVQPGAERLSCIVCKGSGRITINQPYTICKECEGRGKKAGTNLYCLSCQGRGFTEEKKYLSAVGSSEQRKSRRGRRKRTEKKKRIKKLARKEESKKPFKSKKGKPFFKKFLGTFKIL